MPRPIPANHPGGVLTFSTPATYSWLTRQYQAGKAQRIAPGIFALGADLPIEDVTSHHLWAIVAHVWPDAVVCDRSALTGGVTNGWLYLCHPEPPRGADLALPGVTVTCRVGPGPLPGDMPFVDGLTFSGVARGLVENIPTAGRRAHGRSARAGGEKLVGDAIDALASSGEGAKVQMALAQLDQIAGHFPQRSVERTRTLLASALGTVTAGPIVSARLAARVSGLPFDAGRTALFEKMRDALGLLAPSVRPLLGDPATRSWLPFFEAYFSNYIEGTEFSVEEARDIVVVGKVPAGRPADAHDVSATFHIISDESLMREKATTDDEFLDQLTHRHATLMAARPDKNPGIFKTRSNYAGGTAFVAPAQLVGTLRAGWEVLDSVVDPFHRSVLTMFVVSECHPFDDGNGRLARIMANSELVRQDQVRMIIPTSYRGNYLAALTGATHNAAAHALVSALDFTRQWVSSIDWTEWDYTIEQLNASHAFTDSALAEISGNRLRIAPQPRGQWVNGPGTRPTGTAAWPTSPPPTHSSAQAKRSSRETGSASLS